MGLFGMLLEGPGSNRSKVMGKMNTPINLQDAIEWVKPNSVNFYNELIDSYEKKRQNKLLIYKGMTSCGPYILSDPSKIQRESANTYNYYTVLFDNLPSWSEYPKRSKSLICTSELNIAFGYSDTKENGALYIVIPKDNTKIGICPTYDIWDAFDGKLDLIALNNKLHQGGVPVDYDSIISYLQNSAQFKKYDINKVFDPNKNGFKLVTYGKVESLFLGNQEMWMSGECLLVNYDFYQYFAFSASDETSAFKFSEDGEI